MSNATNKPSADPVDSKTLKAIEAKKAKAEKAKARRVALKAKQAEKAKADKIASARVERRMTRVENATLRSEISVDPARNGNQRGRALRGMFAPDGSLVDVNLRGHRAYATFVKAQKSPQTMDQIVEGCKANAIKQDPDYVASGRYVTRVARLFREITKDGIFILRGSNGGIVFGPRTKDGALTLRYDPKAKKAVKKS